MIIDPPSPFAPIEEWQEFLREMKAIREPDQIVLDHIRSAEQVIASKQAS